MTAFRMGLLALLLALPATALAQDDEFGDEGDESSEDGEGHGDEDGEGAEADEDAGDDASEAGGPEEGEPETGDVSQDWAFGPYFRYVFVPSFMLQIFTDAAPTVGEPGFGVAATYRPPEGGMAYEMGIGYQGYGFEDPFRAKGDPVEDTEWLESDLGMLHVTGSLLWTADLVEDQLFLEYGIGLDFGVVLGELRRTEAYRDQNGNWAKCNGQLDPGFAVNGQLYCEAGSVAYDQDGAHYNVVEERVPPVAVLPMLPRVGLAYSPIKELVGKLDLAYGIFQFTIGLSIAYVPAM